MLGELDVHIRNFKAAFQNQIEVIFLRQGALWYASLLEKQSHIRILITTAELCCDWLKS